MIEGKICTFDHSAQYFTVSDPRFAKIVSFLHREGAIKIWTGKIGHLKKGKFVEDKTLTQAFVGTEGMQTVPKCLAGLVNVSQSVWVSNVFWEASGKKWNIDKYGFFDYLVIAHNGKCADKLMSNAGVPHVHKLLQVRFSDHLNVKDKRMQLCSVWALLVCFPRTLALPYEGAHVDDYDIAWIANNTAKIQGQRNQLGSLECWTIFSTREFGSKNKVPQENIPPLKAKEVTDKLLEGLGRVTGKADLPPPTFTKVQLWGAAVPMNVLLVSYSSYFLPVNQRSNKFFKVTQFSCLPLQNTCILLPLKNSSRFFFIPYHTIVVGYMYYGFMMVVCTSDCHIAISIFASRY